MVACGLKRPPEPKDNHIVPSLYSPEIPTPKVEEKK